MRSLFTSDIPGAVPRNRYYDKYLYLQKHLEEIDRFGPKNPEHKRVIEWYSPPKKTPDPIMKNESIIKPHSKIFQEQKSEQNSRLSKSVMLNKIDSVQITDKITESKVQRNNSVLTNAAKRSLADSFNKDINENPYFPHRLPRRHEENQSKLTGKRQWNSSAPENISLPAVNSEYFPKWS